MYKKLIAMAVSLAMVFSTAAPAFASSDAEAAEGTMLPAVSLNPYMPQGTVIPEIPEETETLPEEPEAPVLEPEQPEVPEVPETPEEPETEVLPEEPAEPETPADGEPAEPETPAEKPEEPSEEPEDDDEEEIDKEAEAEKKAAIRYRNGLASYMRSKNSKLGKVWSRNLAQTFIDIGEKHDIDPKVLMAVAQRESTFRSKATSPYGYKGMMQTSDWLAKHYGYKPSDLYKPEVSIDVAARYLKSLKKTFGTYTMALCGYMYGGYAVKKGNYSKKGAWKVMNTRSDIQEYLEKYDFV